MSRLKPPKSSKSQRTVTEGKTPPVLHKVHSTPILKHGNLKGSYHHECNGGDSKDAECLLNGVVSHGEAYRERHGSSESFSSRRKSSGCDLHFDDHDILGRKRNSRTSEILRIQVNDETMDDDEAGNRSPSSVNGDLIEEGWPVKSPVSRDTTYSSEEESPLLRYGSLSEKSAGSSFPKLTRSATEETSV